MHEILIATISGLLVGGITWAIGTLRRRRSERLSDAVLRKIKVLEPEDGALNRGFYEYFCRQIDQAEEEIFVTGEGLDFNITGRGNRRAAEEYHASIRDALARGVSVTRIQTSRPFHARWAAMLQELVERFPNSFHLYVIDNHEYQDLASVCVIDADLKKNVAEFMLSADRDINNVKGRLAGTAVFIHGRFDLARAMRKNILQMKEYSMTRHLTDPADLKEWMEA